MTDEAPQHFGRYQLLERVARGGMAEVFKAKSHGVEGFEKVVVLKRILPELASNQQFVDMFLNEARLSVALSHANIVQVFDLGREEDTYFIAMEYVAGMDFGQAIRACRRGGVASPIELCVYVGCEVARALDYAHRRKDPHGRPLGVVHRDISPQNVLLSFEGEVKVTDFGIAKARSTVEPEGGVKGKVAYMAPEQAVGFPVDARADLYALAVTLYEAIAGRNPFHAQTPEEVRRKVLAGEFKPLREARPEVPAALAKIVEGAMSLEARDRPATAAKLYEDLASFLQGAGRRVGPHDLSEWLQTLRALRLTSKGGAVADEDRSQVSCIDVGAASYTPVVRPHDEVRDATLLALEVHAEESVAAAALDPIVPLAARYSGVVIDRWPTGVVLAFGVEHPDGRDAVTATRQALRFQSAALRAALAKEPIATAGAGVHEARVTVRGDGTPERDAHLEESLSVVKSLAKAARNRVLASARVASAYGDHFEFAAVAQGTVHVKGELATARRRVVGRREVFRMYGELLAKAANEGARVVSLTGGAGVGKTRFLEEVLYRLRKMNHPITWYSATCLFASREVPLAALQAMFRAVLGIDETETEAATRDKARKLRDYGLTPDEMLVAGAALGAVSAGSGHSASMMKTLRSATLKVMAGAASGQVTVFAWDSAEYMDEASRQRVLDLLQDAAEHPLLFVVAGRPGRAWPWESSARHHRLTLDPLDLDELRQLVSLRLGAAAPDELLEDLWGRSGGNPFYAEEYLRGWQRAGAVTVASDAVTFAPNGAPEVPGTVRGFVGSRVSHLGPVERRLLQVASVFGLRFHHDQLAEASATDPLGCAAAIDTLTAAGLLERAGPGESRFAHELLRDVLYDGLALDVRAGVHRAVAEALAKHAPGPMSAERIAHHYRQAGDRAHAAAVLQQAASK